jgi:hypothetical protein
LFAKKIVCLLPTGAAEGQGRRDRVDAGVCRRRAGHVPFSFLGHTAPSIRALSALVSGDS